jgi:hypothetical protein
MKFATKLALSTLMLAVAGALVVRPAHADSHTERLNAEFKPSTLTRAEVRANLLLALRTGTAGHTTREGEPVAQTPFRSTRTRAEVAAEAREANRLSQLAPRAVAFDGPPTALALRNTAAR